MDYGMEKKLKEMLLAIGSLAEIGGFLRDALVDNGFTREEACKITSDVLISFINTGNEKNKEK